MTMSAKLHDGALDRNDNVCKALRYIGITMSARLHDGALDRNDSVCKTLH